jgi:hypothetical protein
MKKNGLFLALLFVCGVSAAQTPTFEKGDKVLNLGIGFGGNYYSSYSSGYSKTPFLSASLDVGVVDGVFDKGTIGVGGYIGFSSSKWDSGSDYGWKESDLIIGPRGTLNYPLVDKLDTYAGLLLAYHSVTFKRTGNWSGYPDYSASSSGVYFSGFIGARYYFSNNFGVMLELGSGGLALASLGITLKL